MVDEGAQESTNVTVQTTAKHSKGNKNGPALPVFNADASKVTVKGMGTTKNFFLFLKLFSKHSLVILFSGIKKAFVGKQNQFTVNCSEAGNSKLLF